ncbi:motility associated factor glycosyltransferase family protein [Sporosarcina obsidiansis]|uniref:motility associated factor glycosyltransferase family protein n=1 Tax=Sporosarcina obsidiansis TaxID=2660748 RepID=UPI001891357C|nr:6-hydroxymethylpterin diphosphokinase MptE-like protein [Sporosarcina obsidiansis]
MILIDNRNVLRLKDRELLQRLSKWDDQPASGTVFSEPAKTGALTIKVLYDDKLLYLQSKYDPLKEAQRFAGKFDSESIKHVLFAGIGTGAHIQAFMEKHPDTKFSIYEPNEEVLHMYLSNFRLDDLPIRQLEKIFTGTDEEMVMADVQQILAESNNVLKIITLPVYEKIYGEQIQIIFQKALESVKDRHSALATNVAFQKRWTINSIKNFPTVLQTPNILHDIDRSAFKGKPAIIVAAGPSLNEEFENLRYIKEHGLAYIFSVGSAINALIEQEIFPDAACTYDPQDINYRVIQVIKDKEITEIPLIFGSSVGFETLENYPGEMLHMIVNQDTVTPTLLELDDEERLDIINDAPSIAVITFQLLAKLQVSQIILVGQNLAYINNQHYALGIDYGSGSSIVTEEKLQSALVIKDVYGNDVKTTEGFNRMRTQLEMYISLYPQIKVWNTTKGGAVIHGTLFKTLESIITDELKSDEYQKGWQNCTNQYNLENLGRKLTEMGIEANILESAINKIFSTLKSINQEVNLKRTVQLEKKYPQLDQKMKEVKNNIFFNTFVEPMIRVQQERLSKNIQIVRYEKNAIKKGEVIVEEFTIFVAECAQNFNLAFQLYKEMTDKIETILK